MTAVRTSAAKGSELAKARIEAHRSFDVLWRFDLMTRREAYAWLAEKMGLAIGDCHIGMFDLSQCQQAINLCENRSAFAPFGQDTGVQTE
jgi:hypothetical protein